MRTIDEIVQRMKEIEVEAMKDFALSVDAGEGEGDTLHRVVQAAIAAALRVVAEAGNRGDFAPHNWHFKLFRAADALEAGDGE